MIQHRITEWAAPFKWQGVARSGLASIADMKRLDGSDFYRWGVAVKALIDLNDEINNQELLEACLAAMPVLINAKNTTLDLSVTETSRDHLFYTIYNNLNRIKEAVKNGDTLRDLTASIRSSAQNYENILLAALERCDTYQVSFKKGYRSSALIDNGLSLFPNELALKVPCAIFDVEQACRCYAFELYTATSFHLHRANESVMHAYYDAVTGGRARPKNRNMGTYIRILKDNNFGDPKVIAYLTHIKDFHRNFVAHPDRNIVNIDEVSALMSMINSAIYQMLPEIHVQKNDIFSGPNAS